MRQKDQQNENLQQHLRDLEVQLIKMEEQMRQRRAWGLSPEV